MFLRQIIINNKSDFNTVTLLSAIDIPILVAFLVSPKMLYIICLIACKLKLQKNGAPLLKIYQQIRSCGTFYLYQSHAEQQMKLIWCAQFSVASSMLRFLRHSQAPIQMVHT